MEFIKKYQPKPWRSIIFPHATESSCSTSTNVSTSTWPPKPKPRYSISKPSVLNVTFDNETRIKMIEDKEDSVRTSSSESALLSLPHSDVEKQSSDSTENELFFIIKEDPKPAYKKKITERKDSHKPRPKSYCDEFDEIFRVPIKGDDQLQGFTVDLAKIEVPAIEPVSAKRVHLSSSKTRAKGVACDKLTELPSQAIGTSLGALSLVLLLSIGLLIFILVYVAVRFSFTSGVMICL